MQPRSTTFRRRTAALFGAALLGAACFAVPAPAADPAALEAKVEEARLQASALAADLEARQAEMLAAREQAAAAAAREAQLSAVLAEGEERAAALAAKVVQTAERLAVEKARLRRARAALAERIVAIYKAGVPDATAVILSADGFEDLLTRSDYLRMIEDSDTRLAGRVREIRNRIAAALALVEELKARQDAFNARVDAARAQIAAVRAEAEAAAAELAEIAAAREATLATVQANIGTWMDEIQAARAAAAREASEAAAQEEVGSWLGGPWSIPYYIVMCESGGNYGALNPSSGAGGAYQILPSTWELYGGEGAPHEAPKPEQDSIASQIWQDSGPGAWVCAG